MEFDQLKIDFAGCCQAGKEILYQQVVQDRIDIGAFMAHAQGCQQCVRYLNAQLKPLAKSAIKLIPKLMSLGRGTD